MTGLLKKMNKRKLGAILLLNSSLLLIFLWAMNVKRECQLNPEELKLRQAIMTTLGSRNTSEFVKPNERTIIIDGSGLDLNLKRRNKVIPSDISLVNG